MVGGTCTIKRVRGDINPGRRNLLLFMAESLLRFKKKIATYTR